MMLDGIINQLINGVAASCACFWKFPGAASFLDCIPLPPTQISSLPLILYGSKVSPKHGWFSHAPKWSKALLLTVPNGPYSTAISYTSPGCPAGRNTFCAPSTKAMASKPRERSKRAILPAAELVAFYPGTEIFIFAGKRIGSLKHGYPKPLLFPLIKTNDWVDFWVPV